MPSMRSLHAKASALWMPPIPGSPDALMANFLVSRLSFFVRRLSSVVRHLSFVVYPPSSVIRHPSPKHSFLFVSQLFFTQK